MKQFKKLIPALMMLLLSASMMGTSTYAWFSMNRTVTAVGMQVQAVAEDGIVISNTQKSAWADEATAQTTTAQLVPTSAAAIANPAFVHNASTQADDAEAEQAVATYEDLTLAWNYNNTEGIGYVDANTNSALDTDEKSYVLLNNFYIKSSGNALSNVTFYINDVTVTGASKKIDNALRVLVVANNDAFIFAPVSDVDSGTTTLSYKWKNTSTVTAKTATDYDTECPSITSIPNTDADAILVKVYCYFEGEDLNCKSTNVSGIETNSLSVSVKMGIIPTHN